MRFDFSERLRDLKGNAIREIFKALAVPGMISFAGGLPASDCLPAEEIETSVKRVLSSPEKIRVLQYGSTEGYLPLREEGLKYLARSGVSGQSIDNIAVFSGSQQTIDLMCKAFVNKGDVVLVENPTYLAFLHIIKTYEGRAVGVKTDGQGIDLDDLERQIKIHKPKFLYVVPNFSNPTGATLSLSRRKSLAELTARYNLPVLEDDPYREFRYFGNHLPSVKSFDRAGNVIYSVSFSKTLSPALRVALVAGHEDVLSKLVIGKQAADVFTNGIGQAVVHDFLSSGNIEKVIAKALPVYQEKFAQMHKSLQEYMPPSFSALPSEGGMFVWGSFSDGTETRKLFAAALESKVAYVCGSDFYAEEGGQNQLRLNFTNATVEQIQTGVKRLAQIFGGKK